MGSRMGTRAQASQEKKTKAIKADQTWTMAAAGCDKEAMES